MTSLTAASATAMRRMTASARNRRLRPNSTVTWTVGSTCSTTPGAAAAGLCADKLCAGGAASAITGANASSHHAPDRRVQAGIIATNTPFRAFRQNRTP